MRLCILVAFCLLSLCLASEADAAGIFGRIGARIAARQEARQSARAEAGCARSGGPGVGLLRIILPPYGR